MATLTVRKLDDAVYDALRRRAALHRRSMEAEARALLRDSLQPTYSQAEREKALDELQEMGRKWRAAQNAPAGWSFTDADIAERHLEAAWEDERVTNEERQDWLDRLARYEATPEELEIFVTGRTPRLP